MELSIDYSGISKPAVHPNDEEWEAPNHVFFGRKLPGGKKEREPVYVHQSYPKMLYSQVDDRIVAKQVTSKPEQDALGDKWKESPAAFGYIGAPSFEQAHQLIEQARSKTLQLKK